MKENALQKRLQKWSPFRSLHFCKHYKLTHQHKHTTLKLRQSQPIVDQLI